MLKVKNLNCTIVELRICSEREEIKFMVKYVVLCVRKHCPTPRILDAPPPQNLLPKVNMSYYR